MSTAAVLLAAGSGSRVGSEVTKVLLPLLDEPLLVHSLQTVLELPDVTRVLLVVRPGDRDAVAAAVTPHLGEREVAMIDGGTTRHASEWAAVQALAPAIERGEVDVVAIHDAARPLAAVRLWQQVVDAARERGAAIPVVATTDLIGRDGTPRPSTGLGTVQTPQAFRATDLLAAHRAAHDDGFEGTDTAAVLARHGGPPVAAVSSTALNLKVTFPEDLALATALLQRD